MPGKHVVPVRVLGSRPTSSATWKLNSLGMNAALKTDGSLIGVGFDYSGFLQLSIRFIMEVFKYYFGSYTEDTMYLKMDESSDIPFWNLYSAGGKMLTIHSSGTTDELEWRHWMAIGKILEIHRQVKLGLLEYDPYILKHRKKL